MPAAAMYVASGSGLVDGRPARTEMLPSNIVKSGPSRESSVFALATLPSRVLAKPAGADNAASVKVCAEADTAATGLKLLRSCAVSVPRRTPTQSLTVDTDVTRSMIVAAIALASTLLLAPPGRELGAAICVSLGTKFVSTSKTLVAAPSPFATV